jgi:hypothetical protein
MHQAVSCSTLFYLWTGSSSPVALHTLRNNSLPVSPFLERFLDTSDPEVHKGQPFSYDLADSLGPQEFEGPLAFVRRIVWATELVLGMPNSAAISL